MPSSFISRRLRSQKIKWLLLVQSAPARLTYKQRRIAVDDC
jgi:hypothetical protein